MSNEKANIGRLFDRIASTYDRFNHLTSLGIDIYWRRVAIRGMQPVQHLLDVAIGTADVAIMALRHHRAERVTGIDLSPEMMAVGRRKAQRAGLAERIDFVEGSALEMPFADSSFQAVSCAYGVRNFSDLDRGLGEMYRVLQPGGQLLILEFSYPRNPLIRWAYDLYFSHLMPLIGRVVSRGHSADGNGGDAYIYFLNSVKHFIWGDEMVSHLRQAGFADARFRTLTFGITTLYTATK